MSLDSVNVPPLKHFHANAKAMNFAHNYRSSNVLANAQAKAFSALHKYVKLERYFFTGGYLHSSNIVDISFAASWSVLEIRCELFPNTHLYTGNTYDIAITETTIYSKWEFKAQGILKELHEGTDGFAKLTFQLRSNDPSVVPVIPPVTDFTTALREAKGILHDPHDETCMCQECMEERKHEFPI